MSRAGAIGFVFLAVAAAQHGPVRHIPTATPVSAESPYASGCNGAQTGRNFRNSAVEAWVAVDPRNPLHLVGAWQQDRWSNGGASGLLAAASFDGGGTWTRSSPAFSSCASGTSRFARASDPWVTISPNGIVHYMSLSLGGPNNTHAMMASRSTDGGLTWSPPVALIQEAGPDILNDKNSMTADPRDSDYVYAVWDRLSGLAAANASNFRGPSYFARTIDGGLTWEPARQIFDPGANAQTVANQIVVLPDGTLINGFTWVQNAAAPLVRDERLQAAIIRSTDQGLTWSPAIVVAKMQPVGVSNVKTGIPVRSGAVIPAFAADPVTGVLYSVWEDGRFSGGKREGVAFARSTDGGLTWSEPAQINQAPEVQAFTPAVAAGNGTVAVSYYDFRKDTDDRGTLMTSQWRLISSDGGRSWTEAPLSDPFNLASAPVTDGGGYFVGDYQGLTAVGDRFLAFFAIAGQGNLPSAVVAATRPSGSDRSSNGRTEVNRYALRRRVELRNMRK